MSLIDCHLLLRLPVDAGELDPVKLVIDRRQKERLASWLCVQLKFGKG
ncbi:MAG TPA: hypothetical protein VI566_05100 [Xanthomonadales bacterium]|nr:hypothetical protein [Xanthomonadales bacterium]